MQAPISEAAITTITQPFSPSNPFIVLAEMSQPVMVSGKISAPVASSRERWVYLNNVLSTPGPYTDPDAFDPSEGALERMENYKLLFVNP